MRNVNIPVTTMAAQPEICVYQQKLLNTQKMFLEQQTMMKSLSDTVQKIQDKLQTGSKLMLNKNKRKIREISSDEPGESDIESGEYSSPSEGERDSSPLLKPDELPGHGSTERKKKLLKTTEKTFGKESELGDLLDPDLANTLKRVLMLM